MTGERVEQLDLFPDLPEPVEPEKTPQQLCPNPMVQTFGFGPEGQRCKGCRHLYAKRYTTTYYKCDLRGDTNGPGTDHRVRWPACAKYEEDDQP